MSGPSSPGSASINRKGRPLFTSTDGPAILQTRSFRQSKLTWIIRDLWIPSVQSMGFGHTRFSSVGARCIMGGKLLRDFTGGTLMKKAKNASPQERLEIVKDCLVRERNYRETDRKYVCSYQQVRNCVQKYGTMGKPTWRSEGESGQAPCRPAPRKRNGRRSWNGKRKNCRWRIS